MKTQLTILLIVTGLVACYKENPVNPKSVIKRITSNKPSILADGVDTTTITVLLPDETASDRRIVSFKTTKGVFVENEKNEVNVKAQLDRANQLVATVYLRSTTNVEHAIVSAEIAEVKDTVRVSFRRAYPNRILIRTDKLSVQPSVSSEATLVVEQRRSVGIVSLGTVASLTVVGNDNKPRGRFRNPQPESDGNGKSTFIYTLGTDTTYTGELKALATVWDSTLQKSVTSETLLFYSIKSK